MVEPEAVPRQNWRGWRLLSTPLNASAGGGHPESVDARAAVWHERGGESVAPRVGPTDHARAGGARHGHDCACG